MCISSTPKPKIKVAQKGDNVEIVDIKPLKKPFEQKKEKNKDEIEDADFEVVD